MDIDRLEYSKPESSRDFAPTVPKSVNTDFGSEDLPPVGNPDGYSKPEMAVETVCMFLVSGGEKRERDYFKYLESCASRRLRVVFVSKKRQGLTPSQMQKIVEDAIEEECFLDYYGHLAYFAENDIIYLISDVDQYGTELERLVCNAVSVYQWIISNPAFEVWLYYHFYESPEYILSAADIPIAQRSQWLKDQLHKLREAAGGVNAAEAIRLIETAIKNSKRNYSVSEDKIPELFSTQMHIVAEHLLNILDDDFFKMIKYRDSLANDFLRSTQ